MDYIKYDIKEGSTLESIAKEKGVSVKELLDFHNSKASMTQQIYGIHIPLHVVSINIPLQKIAKVDFESAKIEEGASARYRCETSNVILVDGKPNFSARVKTEYLCGLVEANDVKTFTIELKDYVNSINLSEMEPAFGLVKQIEAVRNSSFLSNSKWKNK